MLTNLSSVPSLDPSGTTQQMFFVGLRPGVNAQSYENAIFAKLGLSEEKDVNRRVKAVLVFLSQREER